ncbi:MAG: DivIVA domain-containing protein [Synergistaceae bacterium]|jgi:cell division initiation protein|nr:DivIVA domain-containing protein [Synergistaceae bacterium]
MMSDLLSSLDVVNQAFKKTMRGYDPAEVDEFLDKVAECIQVYVQRAKDYERIMEEQAERLGDYDNIKGSLHEALLVAQRTSEEKLRNATRVAEETINSAALAYEDKLAAAARIAEDRINQANMAAENIVAEARIKAERMIQDTESAIANYGHEIQNLQSLRNAGFANIRSFIGEISSVIDRAESTGRIQVPTSAFNIMNRHDTAVTQPHHHQIPTVAPSPTITELEVKRQEVSETLAMLGIDPNLLNVNAEIS